MRMNPYCCPDTIAQLVELHEAALHELLPYASVQYASVQYASGAGLVRSVGG